MFVKTDGPVECLRNYDYVRLSSECSYDERVYHINYLSKVCNYNKKYFIKLLLRGIDNNDNCVINVLFEYFKVPTNLTLKEKLVYFQLLGD